MNALSHGIAPMGLADLAISLKAPVFPCYISKNPATKTGFYEASDNPAAIRAMFAKPHCQLIGMPTGPKTGFVAVDIDTKGSRRGLEWVNANKGRLPETRTIRTKSGGLHLYFKYPTDGAEIRNSKGGIAPNVDVRGDGGYVIVGPAPLYQVIDDAPIADLPDWLLTELCRVKQEAKAERPANVQPRTDQLDRRYQGLVSKLLDNVRAAPDGQKHDVLLSNARTLGGIIDHAGIPFEDAVRWLLGALPDSVENWRTAEGTSRDGLAHGRASPITLDDRPHPAANQEGEHPAAPFLEKMLADVAASRPAPISYAESQSEPADDDAEADKFGRLRVLSVEDALTAPPRTYLLEGLMAPGEMSVWWGAPKCGKSFLMLRLAYGLAQGRGMWDRQAEKVPVLYVAAEGEGGVMGRIRALHDTMGPAPGFRFIAQSVDMFDPRADLKDLIGAAKAVRAKLLVLDTLARTIGAGDENSARDMGCFVRNCDAIREQTGAHVAVVHHSGWNGEHSRGSIALPGAVDLSVRVSGDANGPKAATVEAVKDGESGMTLGFELQSCRLPPDAKGNPRTTCVAVETAGKSIPAQHKSDNLKGDEPGWLKDLQDMFAAPNGPAKPRMPIEGMNPCRTLLRDEVRDGYRRCGRLGNGEVTQPLTPAERKKQHDKLNALKDKGKIGLTDAMVWLL